MKSKREIELEKCLEKTLDGVVRLNQRSEKLNCHEWNVLQYLCGTFNIQRRIKNRIQRVLKDGE